MSRVGTETSTASAMRASFNSTQGTGHAQATAPAVGNAANAPGTSRSFAQGFQSFRNTISNAFSSFKTTVGEGVASLKQAHADWKAERAHQQNNTRLDRADRMAIEAMPERHRPKPVGINVSDCTKAFKPTTDGQPLTKAHVSYVSEGFIAAIARDSKESGIPRDAKQTEMVGKLMSQASADTLRTLDADALERIAGEFRQEGRTEKADFAKALADGVRLARTPEGARANFLAAARKEMAQSGTSETFLRGTQGGSGSAAVRKLLDGSGLPAYEQGLRTAAAGLRDLPDVDVLSQELADLGIKSLANDTIPRDLADRLMVLAGNMFDHMAAVPVPDDVRNVFTDLSGELAKHQGARTDEMSRVLYSDGFVLKGINPSIVKEQNLPLALKLASQLEQVVANGARDKSNYQPETLAAFKAGAPVVHDKIQTFLVANGMPQSARTTW